MDAPVNILKQKNEIFLNPSNANPTKWSNTLKQFVKQPMNCLGVFVQFVGSPLKGLTNAKKIL